jgi:hypothetical protein
MRGAGRSTLEAALGVGMKCFSQSRESGSGQRRDQATSLGHGRPDFLVLIKLEVCVRSKLAHRLEF